MRYEAVTVLSADTSFDIENMQIEQLRQMHPWRKMALMAEMSQTVRTLALAGLHQHRLDNSPARRRRRMADLLLGPELAARATVPRWSERNVDRANCGHAGSG